MTTRVGIRRIRAELLLLGVGLYDSAFIEKVKRTRQYAIEDFEFVRDFTSRFARIITTPHILAELSNLALDGADLRRRPFVEMIIEVIRQTKELYVEKDAILETEYLTRIGVTDTGIVELARKKSYLVLTDDFPLSGYLQKYECDVVNLNHIRTARWFGQRRGR